jgi:hypothetical protein
MHLAAAAPRGPLENSLPGTVTKISYLGTHLQVALQIADGPEVSITGPLSPEGGDDFRFAVGDAAHVTWPVARSLCFPEVEG